MFVVTATVNVKPESRKEFLAGVELNARTSAKAEPGCRSFSINQSTENPDTYIFIEQYDSEQDYHEGHRGSEHYRAWREVAGRTTDGVTVAFFTNLLVASKGQD